MTRVATIPLQRTLSGALQRSQHNLATSQMQLTTGKKAHDYSGLGLEAVRTLSARSMLAQQESYQAVGSRVGTSLTLYGANVTQIDDAMGELRSQLLNALGTGNSPGLQDQIEQAFGSLRGSLNATEAGVPLFAGAQIDEKPFIPDQLSDLVGLAPTDAFANDNVRQSSRLGDGVDVEYGIVADEVAANLIPPLRTLAEAAPFGERLTAAQKVAIEKALGELDIGLRDVRAVNAAIGQTQNQVEALQERATDRTILLTEVIGSVEDADLGKVALDISQRKTILEASYSVFSQLSGLSLVRFLD